MATPPVALQLYTVREDAARDFAGTLEAVATLGYTGVELAGYHGMSASDLRAKLASLGLSVAASHVPWARLEAELPQVIEECHTLRCEYLVCPALPNELRTAAGYQAVGQSLNEMGQTLQANDMHLCYHNHNWEFAAETAIDGANAYDWLLTHTDPTVQFELDVYWVQKAGRNPVEYLAQYGGRFPLVHLKDITKDARETFAPVGTGSMNFGPIFAAAETSGVAWYIVEQDRSDGSALDDAGTSLRNLKAMGKA